MRAMSRPPTTSPAKIQMANDDAHADAVARYVGGRVKRGRVIQAARNRDVAALERLTANDPELTSLAFRQLATLRPGRGRKQGEPRPTDLSQLERVVLEDALAEIDRMRHIMMTTWSRWKGTENIAMEIAAERAFVDLEQLIRFRQHR